MSSQRRVEIPFRLSSQTDVAVQAVDLLRSGKCRDPRQAWDQAAAFVFPARLRASRAKVCPRSAFLGLCEEGLVTGFAKGPFAAASENKARALQAVRLLRKDPEIAEEGGAALWRRVLAGKEKAHNRQMDVVLALWAGGFIRRG